jgi:cytoplasmic iron level regulating protein YaaA (DUF328/UPF0246 family)
MTLKEYIQDILNEVDEQEIDQWLIDLRSVANKHNVSPFQLMIDLLQFKQREERDRYYQEKFDIH